MSTRAPVLSYTSVVFVLVLLVGALLGQSLYWLAAVMVDLPHGVAALAGLVVQVPLQRALVGRVHGERRWRFHLTYATLAWIGSMAMYRAGGSAFFAQAAVVLTVVPIGGLVCGMLDRPAPPLGVLGRLRDRRGRHDIGAHDVSA